MPAKTIGASSLAGRYAAAVFELAEDRGQLEPVAADLTALGAMIRENADLARLVRSPVVSRAEQKRAILLIMERVGMGELARNFVGVVADKRRLFALTEMIGAYQGLLARHRGEVAAEVISAAALTEAQHEAVQSTLNRALGTRVSVETKVEPGLLGGLVVKLGSRMVDSSLRTKLDRLRLAMRGIG